MFDKIFRSLTKAGLRKKIIAGYIMIILIPSALLGTLIYQQFYNIMMKEYVNQKQQILNEYYFNMEKDLDRIQDIYSLFQCNTNIVNYLNGDYISDSDNVYIFSKYIKQFYGYVYASMPFINYINIYKINENILTIPSSIDNMKSLDNAKAICSMLTAGKGVWSCKQENKGDLPNIKYYIKIYNNDFYKELGVLEIQINSEVMSDYINNIQSMSMGNNGIYLLDMNDDILYKTGNKIFQNDEAKLDKLLKCRKSNGSFSVKVDGKKIIGNVIYIKALNIKTIVLEDKIGELKYLNVKKSTVFLYVILLFLVLSAIYYFIATNITTRVVKLAKHMRKVDENNILLYTGKKGQDEIGFLIDSYNAMIMRMDELVNNVHKAELLRKEAAYAAMQAQIRPHFLFGTLESIRMLAESNKDFDVSNIIFTFGRLMRYSLSSSKNEVTLKEEVENVTNYLEIQKIRMGERLQYEVNSESELELDRFYCPRFILQPLVENSIVHGIAKCRGRGFISISVAIKAEYVVITIYDNGHGISPEELLVINKVLDNEIDIKDFQTENSGFGVYNVSERIKAYFGQGSRLVLSSKINEGTTCALYLYRYKGDVNNEDNDRR